MYPLHKFKWLGGLFACFSLTTALSYAQTSDNLVKNGSFGTATYSTGGSTFNPSAMNWSTSGAFGFKTQVIPTQCTEFGCYSAAAYNWYCGTNTGQATLTQQFTSLKPNTRYNIGFKAFRDSSNVAVGDSSLSEPTNFEVQLYSFAQGAFLVKQSALNSYRGMSTNASQGTFSYNYEFTTPVAKSDSGSDNLSNPQLTFRWSPNVKHQVCLTDISVKEVSQPQAESRVVVNTVGYPLNGSKVATLVVPATTNPAALKWRLRYGSTGFAATSYSVGISFYAVVTDTNGQPVKNTAGYTLQTNADGSPKVVGGTGTGGTGSYQIAGSLGTDTKPKFDEDSGDYYVAIDFSDFGKTKVTESSPITNGTVTPSKYVANDGKTYYILSSSTVTTSCRTCVGGSFYIDVIDSSNNVVARSKNFSITAKPFENLKKDALYSFYHQRSGIAIDPLFNKVSFGTDQIVRKHGAGHAPDRAGCWANAASKIDLHGNDWGSATSSCIGYIEDFSGGWYDAADHGKYIVNGGIALWTLQNMIERLQTKNTLNTAFPAGQLSLPPTLNDKKNTQLVVSDLLAEARVEMEWMLKMQIPSDNAFKMKVPLGYQDRKLAATTELNGIYQVDLKGASKGLNDNGAVSFGGGYLPRLRMKLNLTEIDVSGMVFHAIHDRNWTNIPLDPSKDTQERVLMYPTSAATLNFAAVAAQCSRIWKDIDADFATKCFNAATKAWDKAKLLRTGIKVGENVYEGAKSDIFRYEYSNQPWNATDTVPNKVDPNIRDFGPNNTVLVNGFALNPMFNGGGAYGDLRLGDEFYWAGAELYLATVARGSPEISYHTYGKSQGVLAGNDIYGLYSGCAQKVEPIQCYNWINGFDWQNTTALGTLSLLTYNNGSLASTNAKTNLFTFADTLAGQAEKQGYTFAKAVFNAADRNTHYEWGSNGGVLNRAIILGTAADLQTDPVKKSKYLAAIVNSMGYLLGRNAQEKSYISGYGNNPMSNPHHRWFAKHAHVAYPLIPAGFIAGGPNTRDIPALRANAPRYETQAAVSNAIAAGDLEATLGGISDKSQRYFDSDIVANCVKEDEPSLPAYKPQKCYGDHYRSFATNEIAVNWQAPLVWVAQFLSENY